MEDLDLDLGPSAPAIVKQLADRGLKPRQSYFLDLWEGWASRLSDLDNCGLVSEYEAKRIRLRFVARIAANVEKLP